MVDAGANASGNNKQVTGATMQKEPPLPRSGYAAAADAQQNQKNEDEVNSGVRVSPVRTRRASGSLRRSSDRSRAPSPAAAEDAHNTNEKAGSRDRRVDKAHSKKSIVCVWSVWQPRPKISAFANQDHHRAAGQGLSVSERERLRGCVFVVFVAGKSMHANLEDPKFVRALKKEVYEKTEALPREVRYRFGEIVWVKLNGYPFWPGLIMDPRKLPPKMMYSASKGIGTKFWLYFYGTHDFAAIGYKNVVPWNDETYPYRQGYPAKEAKTSVRKEQLELALSEADSEQSLPLTERIDWLIKDAPVEVASSKKTKDKSKGKADKSRSVVAAVAPRSDNRNFRNGAWQALANVNQASPQAAGSNAGKTGIASIAKAAVTAALSSVTKSTMTQVAPTTTTSLTQAVSSTETAAVPSLPLTSGAAEATDRVSTQSPVLIRPTPVVRVPTPPTSRSATTAAVSAAKPAPPVEGERRRRRSAPSGAASSICEDKVPYTVGPLAPFAKKLTEFYAQVSTSGNWKIMTMLSQLLNEKVIYRSDLERSGLGSVLAEIRKSKNPHVVQTAKNVCVHLMICLKDDEPPDSSATASGEDSSKASRPAKKMKTDRTTLNEPATTNSSHRELVCGANLASVDEVETAEPTSQDEALNTVESNTKLEHEEETTEAAPSASDLDRPLTVHLVKNGQGYTPISSKAPQQSSITPNSLPLRSEASAPRSRTREQSATRAIDRPVQSADSDIDFALALIQNVRSRAGGSSRSRSATADMVKPEPERIATLLHHSSSTYRDIGHNSRTSSARTSPALAPQVQSVDYVRRMEDESRILERCRGRNEPPQQQQGGKASETQQSQPSAASRLPYPLSTLPEKRNPALVIFNKDGTLIDFNSMWGGWIESQAWKLETAAKLAIREQLYGAMGYDWSHRSVARFGALTTMPKKDLSRVAVDVLLVKGMALSEAQRVVRECWSLPDPVMTCRPLADIPDIFRTIKQMGIKIAIRTTDNRESTKKSLAHMCLTNLVDDMVCGDDGLPIAPSPEQVWTLCNRLGVGVYNTVMVGDTPSDMALGRNSACSLSVGVFGGASALDDLAKDADILISSLDKITRVLFQYGQQASQQ